MSVSIHFQVSDTMTALRIEGDDLTDVMALRELVRSDVNDEMQMCLEALFTQSEGQLDSDDDE